VARDGLEVACYGGNDNRHYHSFPSGFTARPDAVTAAFRLTSRRLNGERGQLDGLHASITAALLRWSRYRGGGVLADDTLTVTKLDPAGLFGPTFPMLAVIEAESPPTPSTQPPSRRQAADRYHVPPPRHGTGAVPCTGRPP